MGIVGDIHFGLHKPGPAIFETAVDVGIATLLLPPPTDVHQARMHLETSQWRVEASGGIIEHMFDPDPAPFAMVHVMSQDIGDSSASGLR